MTKIKVRKTVKNLVVDFLVIWRVDITAKDKIKCQRKIEKYRFIDFSTSYQILKNDKFKIAQITETTHNCKFYWTYLNEGGLGGTPS